MSVNAVSRFSRSNHDLHFLQPFLLSLGFPDTSLPQLVLAGPVAGLLVPPLVSVLDRSRQTARNNRRSLIVSGGVGAILGMMCMAFASDITNTIDKICGIGISPLYLATTSIYGLNIAMQPLQLGLRAALVDRFNAQDQPMANLWASRFSVLGSILVTTIGTYWRPSLKALAPLCCSIMAVLLLGYFSCRSTTRCDMTVIEEPAIGFCQSFTRQLKHFVHTIRRLPSMTKRVCRVQLFAWFAWFLTLNYSNV